MIFSIGSARAPKVNGVKTALQKLSILFDFDFSKIIFDEHSVESGVSATPLSIEELIDGGKIRALKAYEKISNSDKIKFGVGVEGGVFKISEKGFLQSWTIIFDGEKYFYGSSGAIEIPSSLFTSLFIEKKDLGNVIDIFSQKIDVRSNEGTWGILTNDFYSREDSFCDSTINALVPIFNKKIYEKII